ncbi:DNA-directed RNA polymerase II subunit GRINL1A-like [Montipora capricornis]|uniref:DNA-directed RNA polymerase II subunit GRINL1A-like n=1 Tax=Montipora foliosa TaxID=591990 RepID=UPI0035F16C27
MAEKMDWTKLSKRELQEILIRQEKLLANKKFIQSLPDKGNKVLATIEKLKEMIARRDDLEEAVAQFEKMTVSRLVERTRLDLSDNDDDISDARKDTSDSDVHYKPRHKNNKKISISHSENRQTKQMSYKEWNFESSATPPVYKLEKSKPVSLDQSFKLLQEQEKRYKDLQAENATFKLKDQDSFTRTVPMMTLSLQSTLQYRESTENEILSDDDEHYDEDTKPAEVDSDDFEDKG